MTTTTTTPDFAAIKQRQQATWSAGDYAVVGTTLQIVGERLCEAADVRAGEHVLDVAAGNGNATLAAARRFGEVTSTDYVGELLERGKARAEAEGLHVKFRVADAEALPCADGEYDCVLSTFGVMFTPNQPQAASELLRVCRSGGRIALANWTPESYIGQLFRVLGSYIPPAAGVQPPSLWGTEARLAELFAGHEIRASKQVFNFRYRSARHWLDVFATYYGPTNRALASLDETKRAALENDILALLDRFNIAGPDSLVVPSEYLEAIIVKR